MKSTHGSVPTLWSTQNPYCLCGFKKKMQSLVNMTKIQKMSKPILNFGEEFFLQFSFCAKKQRKRPKHLDGLVSP